MDLKDMPPAGIAAIASAISATCIGLIQYFYTRVIKKDEYVQKRLTDQQDHSQELELSDRAEMLKLLKSQIKSLDSRVKSLEELLERYQTERVDNLQTIARLELRNETLERENKSLRKQIGLSEISDPTS